MSNYTALLTAVSETENLQVDVEPTDTLLAALEMGGSQWPSSCRTGACRSCIGQLRQGQIRYDMDWPGLTAEEKAQGYILPCVAYPCTPVVVRQGYAD